MFRSDVSALTWDWSFPASDSAFALAPSAASSFRFSSSFSAFVAESSFFAAS